MSAPAPHPVIAHPLTVIAHRSAGHTVHCAHCDWTYTTSVKTDAEYQDRYHRGQHRTGQTAVTR